MSNVLMVIEPYWYQDTWVFDDASKGLEKEPLEEELDLLGGLSQMIDVLVTHIPNARGGFILLFSSQPFAGYQVELTRVTEEDSGCTYKVKDHGAHVWLSPAPLMYFESAPESLYVKAEPSRGKHELMKDVVALRDRVEELEQLVGKLTLENDLLKRDKEILKRVLV